MSDAPAAESTGRPTYVVVVLHNLVSRVARTGDVTPGRIARSPLEVSTQLAENYRARGTIDGSYYFDDLPQARVFATLCLEFTRALADRRLAILKTLAAGAEFDADAGAAPPAMPGSMR